MNHVTTDLQSKFAEVFATKWNSEDHPQYVDMLDKFVFHMNDASAEIQRLAELLKAPGEHDERAFGKLLHRFFLHAVPHLVAAGQLYDYVPELFAEQRGVHELSATASTPARNTA